MKKIIYFIMTPFMLIDYILLKFTKRKFTMNDINSFYKEFIGLKN